MIFNINTFTNFSLLTNAVATKITNLMQTAISKRGVFHWSLSGGQTPIALYKLLTTPPFIDLPWHQVQAWFGDERIVPEDHPENNGNMLHQSLFNHISISKNNIHRMPCNLSSLRYDAYKYGQLMTTLLPNNNGIPIFDLILLGMGSDGHIASLFPESCALHLNQQIVVANYVPKLNTWRITITLPVIEYARHIIILVSGTEKSQAIYQIFSNNQSLPLLPVQRLTPHGILEWYVDQDAAQLI